MSGTEITLTIGWIARHTQKGAGAGGRDAAVLDIAQDLLLRELHATGALDVLIFKGGTALRKLYAGNQGRFSLDLDFSLAVPTDSAAVVSDLVMNIDGSHIGPFTYGVSERRGKWSVTVTSPFNDGDTPLSSKLDISPPVWLDPVRRGCQHPSAAASPSSPSSTLRNDNSRRRVSKTATLPFACWPSCPAGVLRTSASTDSGRVQRP